MSQEVEGETIQVDVNRDEAGITGKDERSKWAYLPSDKWPSPPADRVMLTSVCIGINPNLNGPIKMELGT